MPHPTMDHVEMPMTGARPRLIVLAALVVAAVSGVLARETTVATQDAEAAARAALARPVTVGSVPFLIPHARFSNVAARLAGALRHERADVRAVAARSIFVLAGSFYGDAVAEALAVERDPTAGAEMVRALLAIRGAAADADAIAAAGRLGVPALNAVTVTLAHTRPLDVLPHLQDLDPDADGLADALLRAVTVDAERVAGAIDALPADADLAALDRVFPRAAEIGILLPAPMITSSLRRGPATRHATLIHLLEHPPAVASAAVSELGAAAAFADATGWTTVLTELIARGDPSVERHDLRRIVPALDRAAAPSALWHSPAISRLSPDERIALRDHVFAGRGDARKARPRDRQWTQPGIWRIPESFVPGLDAAVADTARCRPGRDEVAVMAVAYGDRGQVREVRFAATSASPACREAAALLAVLEVAPIADLAAAARTDHLVAVFTRETLECERRSSRPPRSTDPNARITSPRKLRDVRPVYPKHLIAARVQGTVIVEALIDGSGCIARAAVIEPVHPELDAAALAAVAQWRFTPTLLNGEPVAVIMTTTVGFNLR